MRLLFGFLLIFVLFHWTAERLGSDRGQAGLIIGALVVAATLAIQRVWFSQTGASAARAIGLGKPGGIGLVLSAGIGLLLVSVIPLFVGMTGASVALAPRALWLLPGLFAQAGIAEEVLFRGYLFGHIRCGRSFWRAATLSMVPFVAVHLLMFVTMPWAIALAALVLAVVLSFPLAHLFELGGNTIWAPALLHFVAQGTVKVLIISGEASALFPFVWIAASAILPMLALLTPRPALSPYFAIRRM